VIKQYVLDSSAIIIYVRNSPDASKVRRVFQEVEAGDAVALISAVNWAECRHVLIRRHGAEQAVELLDQLSQGLMIMPADQAQRRGSRRSPLPIQCKPCGCVRSKSGHQPKGSAGYGRS